MTLPKFQLTNKSGTNYQPIVERFINATEATSKSAKLSYTATEDGWVSAGLLMQGDQSGALTLDGSFTVWSAQNSNSESTRQDCCIPVKKGQTYQLKLASTTTKPATVSHYEFHPCK